MPASPQHRYTRDEQQLSQLLRDIDGVTTRLAARYALLGGELLQDVVSLLETSRALSPAHQSPAGPSSSRHDPAAEIYSGMPSPLIWPTHALTRSSDMSGWLSSSHARPTNLPPATDFESVWS